jgi:hypothetical protein
LVGKNEILFVDLLLVGGGMCFFENEWHGRSL